VPTPPSGCAAGPGEYHCSCWVGIDGWQGSTDVLQVGVEMWLKCHGRTPPLYNYGWVEWYDPVNHNPEIQITNIPVGVGYLVEFYVWIEPPNFYTLYFSSGRKYTALRLTPPRGVVLQGNCVEWVVERPQIGSALANLTNYGFMPWFGVCTYWYPTSGPIIKYKPSSYPSSSTLWTIQLLDDTGKTISIPHSYPGDWPTNWEDGLLFEAHTSW
jgi:Peptidase A4 family